MNLTPEFLDQITPEQAISTGWWQFSFGQLRFWPEDGTWTIDQSPIVPPTAAQLFEMIYYKGKSDGSEDFKRKLHDALGLQDFVKDD